MISLMEIRFTRHGKNKVRLYKLGSADVEEAINCGEKVRRAGKWESRYGKLTVIWVTVGSYILVVTVIKHK